MKEIVLSMSSEEERREKKKNFLPLSLSDGFFFFSSWKTTMREREKKVKRISSRSLSAGPSREECLYTIFSIVRRKIADDDDDFIILFFFVYYRNDTFFSSIWNAWKINLSFTKIFWLSTFISIIEKDFSSIDTRRRRREMFVFLRSCRSVRQVTKSTHSSKKRR